MVQCKKCEVVPGSCGKVHNDGKAKHLSHHVYDDSRIVESTGKPVYLGEVLDDTPLEVEIPVKGTSTGDLASMIASQVRAAVDSSVRHLMDDDPGDLPEDLDVDYDPNARYSPYELVFEQRLGRNITLAEKNFLDEQRNNFDRAFKQLRADQKNGKYPPGGPRISKKDDSGASNPPTLGESAGVIENMET